MPTGLYQTEKMLEASRKRDHAARQRALKERIKRERALKEKAAQQRAARNIAVRSRVSRVKARKPAKTYSEDMIRKAEALAREGSVQEYKAKKAALEKTRAARLRKGK